MKTDKELLELAAKAAGTQLVFSGPDKDMPRVAGSFESWNPLTDDGDALRLAVKLNIDFYFNDSKAGAWINDLTCLTEDINDDKYAATRRAIVRAAAAIGEAK